MPLQFNKHSPELLLMVEKIMKPGKTPKETMSASESSSFPISDFTFSKRAAKPSKKSKTPARNIIILAHSSLPIITKYKPTQPENRFREVMVFGICFIIFIAKQK